MYILRSLYLKTRSIVRSLVHKNPIFDRILGSRLRRVERLLKPYNYLVPIPESGTIHVAGLQLTYHTPEKNLALQFRLTGDYEPETISIIRELLRPSMVVVDLGAHIGYITLVAAQLVAPAGKVFAFEPNPHTCTTLRHNVELNQLGSTVTVVQQAVGEERGTAEFYVSSRASESAKLMSSKGAAASKEIVSVKVTSLDAFFEMQDSWSVNLIKMDVEGAELSALGGLKELSRRNPELKLIVELNYPHLVTQDIKVEQLFEVLQHLGFKHFRMLKVGYNQSLKIPEDIPIIVAVISKMTVNLFCEK